MAARAFWDMLKARGITFFSGVPDSTFQSAYNTMIADPDIRYIPAVREDVALGVASAAYFTGQLGGVVMQNSGLGNLVNPLTSFNLIYRIPALLIVGWRGCGGPPHDAPEHWIMGVKTLELLETLDVPYDILDGDHAEAILDRLLGRIETCEVPGALVVRAGVIT